MAVVQISLYIVWIHNDSMDVRFDGSKKYKDVEQVYSLGSGILNL